ncbi:hypothetical protein HNR64_000242 [Spongiibacter marinus]|nr:hypothetical protein [Spongiibacter marinus]
MHNLHVHTIGMNYFFLIFFSQRKEITLKFRK